MQKQKSWLSSVAVLGILSGIAVGAYGFTDARVVQKHLTDPQDEIIGSLVYLVVGSWIGTLMVWIMGSLMGSWATQGKFQGWRLIQGREWWYVVGSGITGAVATLFYLLAFTITDPGQVAALSGFSLLLLLLIDLKRKKASRGMIGPALLVFIGLILASTHFEGGFFEVTWKVILVVLIARNLFLVVSKIIDKEGSDEKKFPLMDAVNYSLWRMFCFAFASTLAVLLWVSLTGNFEAVSGVLERGMWGAFPFILMTMVLNFFGSVWEMQALWLGGLASLVNFLKKSEIVIGVLGTYLINWGLEGWVGEVHTDFWSVVFRIGGVVAILIGLYPLTRRKMEVEEREKEADTTLVEV